ncbi:hypothetical protein VPNG_00707 [Cytospora leucostoma]|uniref:Xylanolytic transcriptional activator regulatory domain-containing protein n=1 Tax=Cytospora leucostoma TaxID=1230097 RepID=A0A423XMY4_9PEZI|nr:hypothetical protein VPNG_00707 [Cytospora leucostoma]
MHYEPRVETAGAARNELLGLGLFEALPPTEMIEELHQVFFTKQHPLIPIVHPGRYMQAFYSGPHMRPPMALSYAIWTMAANGHENYHSYHDAFHRRARHYLEDDELRGDGEHFITVAHAQAWAIISTDEARCMRFTRSAMSAARCIKLIHMMGLHRLDDPKAAQEMPPTLVPPRDWAELEERRRVFWGALCIDSHAAIATGWPFLINMDDVTTHLPSSEEAFSQCIEEKTCRLEDVFTGSSYSSFAGAAIICHLFNQILKHVHRSKSGDCPENLEYGPYWKKHRELDNLLSGAFMFLPERFRLPKNIRDPVAVNTNLNLHAAVICLHNSAYEMANEYELAETVKQMSKGRLLAAAQEVVNIVKLTSHVKAGSRSPLVALALYVASSVYITMAQDGGLEPVSTANLELLLIAMAAIGKQHLITKSFLHQAIFDLQRAGLSGLVRIPRVEVSGSGIPVASSGGNIPLLARSRVSRNTDIQPPLPGKLPLKNPLGKKQDTVHCLFKSTGHHDGEELGNANKRKRVAVSPDPTPLRPGNDTPQWCPSGSGEGLPPSDSAGRGPALPPAPFPCAAQFRLPNRAGTSTASSPSTATAAENTSTPASTKGAGSGGSSGLTSAGTHTAGAMSSDEGISTGQVADELGIMPAASQENAVDMSMFQSLDAWDVTGDPAQDAAALYAQVAEAMQGNNFVDASDNSGWML